MLKGGLSCWGGGSCHVKGRSLMSKRGGGGSVMLK